MLKNLTDTIKEKQQKVMINSLLKLLPDNPMGWAGGKIIEFLDQKSIDLSEKTENNGVVAFVLLPCDTNGNPDIKISANEVYPDKETGQFIFGKDLLENNISLLELSKNTDVESLLASHFGNKSSIPTPKTTETQEDFEQRNLEEQEVSQVFTKTPENTTVNE